MCEQIRVDKDWYDWLQWFHYEADFGPNEWDVRHIMMEQYEKETGRDCPAREEE